MGDGLPAVRSVSLFGQRIEYYDVGAGPTVVLIHGLGSSAKGDWGACISRLSARHRVLAPDLLGFGGKNSEIDGHMPLARSSDGGKTWKKSATPFDELLSGERPSVIRLASGRLFFVADYNPKHEKHIHLDGAFVALSDDDGAHWTMKRLPPDILTVGYTTATQGPDGVIHVVTSKNKPDYEIELNEAWVLDKNAYGDTDQCFGGAKPAVCPVDQLSVSQQIKNSSGKLVASWSVTGYEGRLLLQGPDQFFYPDGKLMCSADFYLGHKIGEERCLREDGTQIWVKHYAEDGAWTWDNFDASGKRISESRWRGKTLLSSDVPDPPARKKSAAEKPPTPDSE